MSGSIALITYIPLFLPYIYVYEIGNRYVSYILTAIPVVILLTDGKLFYKVYNYGGKERLLIGGVVLTILVNLMLSIFIHSNKYIIAVVGVWCFYVSVVHVKKVVNKSEKLRLDIENFYG
jgi:predicted MFS family arabinose efflux permease